MAADVIIVGAGISGLACARVLAGRGIRVTLLEKSRGVGGRCATRRVRGQPVDHGSAYFHGEDPRFRDELLSLCGDDVIDGWPRVVRGDGTPCQPRALREGGWRLALRGGLTGYAKAVAHDLEVRLDCPVEGVRPAGDSIDVRLGGGGSSRAARVVLATQGSGTRALLPEPSTGGAALAGVAPLLDSVSACRCLTVIAGYPGEFEAPVWEVAYPEDSTILHLISHDSSKRRSPRWTVLVLQARPCWSRLAWDREDHEWVSAMLEEARRLFGFRSDPEWSVPHRWRYARVVGGGNMTSPLLVRLGEARVGITGEAFAPGGGIEAAWTAGRRMAARLLEDMGAS